MSSTSTLRPVRKLAMVLAVAGVAGLGTVAMAPAAMAADDGPVVQDGPAIVQEGNGNGPDYFIVLENGRHIPVFFCDDDEPNQRHNICIPNPEEGPRF